MHSSGVTEAAKKFHYNKVLIRPFSQQQLWNGLEAAVSH
jgi:hypothetical protein